MLLPLEKILGIRNDREDSRLAIYRKKNAWSIQKAELAVRHGDQPNQDLLLLGSEVGPLHFGLF